MLPSLNLMTIRDARASIGCLEAIVDPLDEGIRRIQGGVNAGQGRRDVVALVQISRNPGHERGVLNLLGGDFPVEQLPYAALLIFAISCLSRLANLALISAR